MAIRDYAGRVGKLSEPERLRLLRLFDEVVTCHERERQFERG